VDRAGSVNWWCPARFDAPSVFGRLLDDDAGHWVIQPDGDFTCERAYLDDTLVLRTVFTTRHGSVAVTDALALEPGARGHHIGLARPGCSPGWCGDSPAKFGCGWSTARASSTGWSPPTSPSGRTAGWAATAGADQLILHSSVPLHGGEGEASATFTVGAGSTQAFILGYAPMCDGDERTGRRPTW
jgi:hypothetical protein